MILEETVAEQAKQIERLADALKKATEPPEVPHIEVPNGTNLSGVDLRDMDSGKVRVTMQDPDEAKKKTELKPNEIRRSDQKRINANIEAIGRGEMVLVD